MNRSQAQLEELHRLAGALIDGTIAAGDFCRLQGTLRDDRAAQRFFVQYIDLHASLSRAVASSKAASVPRQTDDRRRSLGSVKAMPLLAALTEWSRRIPGGESTVGMLSILAVIAAFWGLLTFVLPSREGQDRSFAEGSQRSLHKQTSDAAFVAQLIRQQNCVWALNDPLGSGDQSRPQTLTRGQSLQLVSGVADIRFGSGVRLALKGPAKFQVDSSGRCTLDEGQLRAMVPARAVGFIVQTPSIQVIDRGTEFGVEVGKSGETAVRVHVGRVDLAPRDHVVKSFVTLRAGEAANVTKPSKLASAVIRKSTADSQKIDPPSSEGLVLWLRADTIDCQDSTQVRQGPDDTYVKRWPDEAPRSSGPADLSQSIPERQPILLPKALHGMPAVRFVRERVSCLTNEAQTILQPGAPRTVFIVGRAAERADRAVGGELLRIPAHADGGPSFVIQHYFTGPHFNPNQYYVYSDLSSIDLTADDASSVIVHPFVTMFRTSAAGSRAEIQLNGRSWNFAEGVVSKEVAAPGLIIGALGREGLDNLQAWDGDVAEILVYDRALSAPTIQEVTSYLGRKYRLTDALFTEAQNNDPTTPVGVGH